jgi:predicted TIM-barrel fold metal-dependent hydrolase
VKRLTEEALMTVVDVHQHLWPAELIEVLRRRRTPPYLDDWMLHTAAEPPYSLNPADHDPDGRRLLDPGIDQIVLSPSTPIGIEALPPDEAKPLLDAWHDGVAALGTPYRGWAAVTDVDPELAGLKDLLGAGFVGLQVSAARMGTPSGLEQLAPVLEICQDAGAPVLVHPGVVSAASVTPWWSAVVDYPAQLQAAWWSWYAAGRSLLPSLRICFVAGAGLAPSHAERFAARSGDRYRLDRDAYVDTSSYGPRGLDSLIRVLGIDNLVYGTDRPYARPTDPNAGPEATHAIRVANPHRLLTGESS